MQNPRWTQRAYIRPNVYTPHLVLIPVVCSPVVDRQPTCNRHVCFCSGDESPLTGSPHETASHLPFRGVFFSAGSGGQPTHARRGVGKGKPGPSKVGVPHKGIRLALEAVLDCYHPSAPHSVAAVVDALGEDRLEVRLPAHARFTPLYLAGALPLSPQ